MKNNINNNLTILYKVEIMISTKWFQGKENLNEVLNIRKEVFVNELKEDENFITDIYDEFSFNVVEYDESIPVGTGRLLFKGGKYVIDKLCVLKQHRGNNYSEIIIRLLVRKAVNIGAEKTFAFIDKKYENIFKKIGFEEFSSEQNNNVLMVKYGDVGGHCCK